MLFWLVYDAGSERVDGKAGARVWHTQDNVGVWSGKVLIGDAMTRGRKASEKRRNIRAKQSAVENET